MRLDELFDREEWTFRVRDWPDSLAAHVAAHVLGGALFWGAGVLLFRLEGWREVIFAGSVELFRQDGRREIKPGDFPYWAITIDTATALLTGALCSWLLAKVHP